MEQENTCWICLDGPDNPNSSDDLVRVCACPRLCHKQCLGRWQLQNAGKREEKYCRFCQQRYPDWKSSLTPGEITPTTPVMAVSVRGKVYKLRVRPGPEGKEDFKRQIRELLGFSQEMDFDVIFECKTPHNGSEKVQLHGFDAFEAASWCAAVSAAKRKRAKAAAAAAAALAQQPLAGAASCPAALQVPPSGTSRQGSASSSASGGASSAATAAGGDAGAAGDATGRALGSSRSSSASSTSSSTQAAAAAAVAAVGPPAPRVHDCVNHRPPAARLQPAVSTPAALRGGAALSHAPSLLSAATSGLPQAIVEEHAPSSPAGTARVHERCCPVPELHPAGRAKSKAPGKVTRWFQRVLHIADP